VVPRRSRGSWGEPRSGEPDAQDWPENVKKHIPDADEAAIKGIVRHLGIALHGRDASYVSCTDKAERNRVRDGFLKKKLALTDSDADLDAPASTHPR